MRFLRFMACGKHIAFTSTSSLALICAISHGEVARAQTISVADDVLVDFKKPDQPTTPRWYVPGQLLVGYTDEGTMTIDGGGEVYGAAAYIGYQAGSRGHVIVTGSGSEWVSGNSLVVGMYGGGQVQLLKGASLSNPSNTTSYIGWELGSEGIVTISDAGSRWTAGELYIGGSTNNVRGGSGTLNILAGGSVVTGGAAISVGSNGRGKVLVSGTGSTWTNDELSIGNDYGIDPDAVGEMNVADGGRVISKGRGFIGGRNNGGKGSKGTVTVAGAGSGWDVQRDLFIRSGSDSLLMIATGGTVSVGGTVYNSGGTIVIGTNGGGPVAAGTLAAGEIVFTDDSRFPTGGATLRFNHSGQLSFATMLTSGFGAADQQRVDHLAGVTLLTGDSSGFRGTTTVSGGTLLVGDAGGTGALGGTVKVEVGGTLGGSGRLTGPVTINGTLSPGNSPGTLTFGADLILGAGSRTVFELGAPDVVGGPGNDLVIVEGNLTLGGTLEAQVAAAGRYRLFDYRGLLAGSFSDIVLVGTGGFSPGALNTGDLMAGSGDISLSVLGAGQTSLQLWKGGDGVWNAANTNWIDEQGSTAQSWAGSVGVFGGSTGGVVTVEGMQAFDTLQFSTNGYRVEGGSLALDGSGTLNVDAGVSATVASILTDGGARSLAKAGIGTLILTGANSYTGGTSINGGTLEIGNGGTTGSILGPVLNNGTLAFNRADAVTFAGAISGNGVLRQIGSGRMELTGDSSAFTGSTTVEAGTLAVNGKLGGALDVLTAGRLQGSGAVGSTIVRGTIAPGNSIGTLNVAGNITFAAGSIYEVEANAQGQADKIVASGNAVIQGGTVKVLAGAGNYQSQTDYMILTATGGVTGTFANVTSNLAFLDPSLSYDANNVTLHLRRNDVTFPGVGITPNQIATAGAIEKLGRASPVFAAVLNLSASQAQDAFDQLSGEIHASARTAMLEDSRFVRHAVLDRLQGADQDDRGGLWGQAIGSWGHTGGNGNAARLDRSTGGLLMGIDGASDALRLGVIGGYSKTSIDVDARGSSGKIDSFHLGAYAGGQWGHTALRAGIAYSWSDIHTIRNIAFPSFRDTTWAGYHGGTFQAFGELGYSFDLGGTSLEPYAGIAYVRARSGPFRETGGDAKLAGDKAATDITFSTLGLKTGTRFDLGKTSAAFRAGAGWRHAFGDTVPITAMRYQAGGDAFAIGGLPFARDAAILDAGFDIAISGKTSIGLSYAGQIANHLADHTARASIRFKF